MIHAWGTYGKAELSLPYPLLPTPNSLIPLPPVDAGSFAGWVRFFADALAVPGATRVRIFFCIVFCDNAVGSYDYCYYSCL
jgi:hypothetical protein